MNGKLLFSYKTIPTCIKGIQVEGLGLPVSILIPPTSGMLLRIKIKYDAEVLVYTGNPFRILLGNPMELSTLVLYMELKGEASLVYTGSISHNYLR